MNLRASCFSLLISRIIGMCYCALTYDLSYCSSPEMQPHAFSGFLGTPAWEVFSILLKPTEQLSSHNLCIGSVCRCLLVGPPPDFENMSLPCTWKKTLLCPEVQWWGIWRTRQRARTEALPGLYEYIAKVKGSAQSSWTFESWFSHPKHTLHCSSQGESMFWFMTAQCKRTYPFLDECPH